MERAGVLPGMGAREDRPVAAQPEKEQREKITRGALE